MDQKKNYNRGFTEYAACAQAHPQRLAMPHIKHPVYDQPPVSIQYIVKAKQ